MAQIRLDVFAQEGAQNAKHMSEAVFTSGASTLNNKVRVTWNEAHGPDRILAALKAIREEIQLRGVSSGSMKG